MIFFQIPLEGLLIQVWLDHFSLLTSSKSILKQLKCINYKIFIYLRFYLNRQDQYPWDVLFWNSQNHKIKLFEILFYDFANSLLTICFQHNIKIHFTCLFILLGTLYLGCIVGFASRLIYFGFADLNLIFDGACLDRLVCIDWFDRTSQARFLATFRYRSHVHRVVAGTSYYCFAGSPHWPVLL